MSALNQIISSLKPAAGGNGLLTNLVSYYKLDEASGNAIDAHGTNTLAENAGTVSAAGKINDARAFGGGEYLFLADNASLSITGNLGISVWAYPTDTSDMSFVSKYDTNGDQRSYTLFRATNVVSFLVSSDGVNIPFASTTADLTTNAWSHVLGWYDGTNVNVQVNGGTVFSSAHSAGIFNGTAPFQISGLNAGTTYAMIGRIDEAGIWSRAFTSGDRTALYGGGSGLAYSSFT